MIHPKIEAWNKKNPDARCKNCGHKRIDHSEFEESLGDDSHSCEKGIIVGQATFRCICERFEE